MGERKIREEGKTKRERMRVILNWNEWIISVIYLKINSKKHIILVVFLSSFCCFYETMIEVTENGEDGGNHDSKED